MKIALDISPLQTGHKVRGVGSYVRELQKRLEQHRDAVEIDFLSDFTLDLSQYDAVHIPYFDPFGSTIPLRKKTKTIVTIHDLTPILFSDAFPSGLKGNIRWLLNKQLVKQLDAVITDSVSSQTDIILLTGIPKSKVHIVPLAAADHFKKMENGNWKMEISKKYNLPEKFVLYVGDATWNKNLPRLVEAMKEINLTLVMVGKAIADKDVDTTHPWNKDIVAIRQQMEGDKRFIPLGFVPDDDLVKLYNMAEVFVMPSLYEGFGLPVLEAMQCGCPVVTTKLGSLPEVAGEAAFYVDAYDVTNIANGIGEVFFTPKLRDELIKKGFDQAKKFSWEKTALDTLKVYEGVLGGKS